MSTRKGNILLGLTTLAALGLAATTAHAQIAGFSSGSYTLNHTGTGDPASIGSNALQITTAVNDEANSAWYNTPQNIAAFNASFTWTRTGGNSAYDADGYSFALQSTATNALGGGGGAIGYAGANGSSGAQPNVNSSFALGFEYFANPYGEIFAENGLNGGLLPLTDTGLTLTGGPVNVSIGYNGAAATINLNQGSASYTNTYNVDIVRAINGNTAYVGFTGATGGYNVGQQISNFTFTPVTPTASSPNPTPGLINITRSTDSVVSVDAGGVVDPTGAHDSGDGAVTNVVDNNYGTKYLNFTGPGSGLIDTPSVGSSIVQGLMLTSANDASERDPASYILYGSNNGTFTNVISQGTIPAFSSRYQSQYLTFANSTAYTSYELLFPTLANAATANSMQIADIRFLAAAPEPSQYAGLGLGVLGLAGLAFKARKRQSA